jgi:hypothetical protein
LREIEEIIDCSLLIHQKRLTEISVNGNTETEKRNLYLKVENPEKWRLAFREGSVITVYKFNDDNLRISFDSDHEIWKVLKEISEVGLIWKRIELKNSLENIFIDQLKK